MLDTRACIILRSRTILVLLPLLLLLVVLVVVRVLPVVHVRHSRIIYRFLVDLDSRATAQVVYHLDRLCNERLTISTKTHMSLHFRTAVAP